MKPDTRWRWGLAVALLLATLAFACADRTMEPDDTPTMEMADANERVVSDAVLTDLTVDSADVAILDLGAATIPTPTSETLARLLYDDWAPDRLLMLINHRNHYLDVTRRRESGRFSGADC